MNNVYLDFECDNKSDIIEIGALLISNGAILKEFHCFIRRDISLYHYNICAYNSHCIHPMVLHINGLPEEIAFEDFKNFILSIKGNINIRGHGNDVTKTYLESKFPFLRDLPINYLQVYLPVWKDRQYEKFHICALNMKNATRLISCHRDNHKMKFNPTWKHNEITPNHTGIARLTCGFHCALIDCYEQAFYEQKLDYYCCDTHFAINYVYDIIPVVKPYFDTSFNPLIVHSPLEFND